MSSKRLSQALIPFNPAVLKWARNLGDFTPEDAANAAKVTVEKIEEWERFESTPTVRQARLLAELYKRPFLEFFAKEIPNVKQTNLVPDFRLQRKNSSPADKKLLKEIQSWAETQRLNAIDLLELNDEKPRNFPKDLHGILSDDPEIIAEKARAILAFSIRNQLLMKGIEKANFFKSLRKIIETVGVLVLKDSKLKYCEARGLCVFIEPLPVIVVGSESPTGSTFTLCHELGHIILKQSGISGSILVKESSSNNIELWCNRFASAFLMPRDAVHEVTKIKKKLDEVSDESLKVFASKFSVSRHAMLVRLVQLNLVNEKFYWEIKRPQFLKEEEDFQLGGRPTYYGARYRNNNGDFYTSLVLDAWTNGKITNHNAAEFMGIKNLKHLFDIRAHFNE